MLTPALLWLGFFVTMGAMPTRRAPVIYDAESLQEGTIQNALRRSREASDHLQDLLERSDQKAGFVVTGIAFLGIFVQQGGFDHTLTTTALVCYGLAFLCVCFTAMPRQWRWYEKLSAKELAQNHMHTTLQEELDAACSREADLRGIYRYKNIILLVGFLLLMAGMAATQIAVLSK